ncbi:hypothetical protein BGP_0998 [Beggiatoa sp. PS]|nr:hypothetical protein BGP_0998 [Beggiatoa sp. PS]
MRQQYTLKRLFLHAEQLSFELPAINYRLSIHAPLPTALQQVLNRLNGPYVEKNVLNYWYLIGMVLS